MSKEIKKRFEVVSPLVIIWKSSIACSNPKQLFETFRKVKGLERAKKILSRRNWDNIKSAKWFNVELMDLEPFNKLSNRKKPKDATANNR